MLKIIFISVGFLSSLVLAVKDPELSSWAEQQKSTAFERLLKNVNAPGTAKGVVIASPSQHNPDYYYHWVRDAAITMETVFKRYESASKGKDKQRLENLLFDFAEFSLKNQSTPNVISGAGEPKFEVDGSPYLGEWGRPQDDGPALRALVLTHFAGSLLNVGKEAVVRERLYNSSSKSVIKFDLEYVSHAWGNLSIDLWEEVRGRHFFTSMVQRRALIEGAALARRLGDSGAADWYESQGRALERSIVRFWDAKKNLIVPTVDRSSGVYYKESGLDSSVIIGVLLGYAGDGFMPLADPKVTRTAAALEKVFQDLYPINQNGVEGTAIGRYPEDRYDGYSTNGLGNPWVLNTAYFAQYYYRLAREIEDSGRTDGDFIIDEFGFSQPYTRLVKALRGKADTFLSRVKYHGDAGGVYAEQINRHSGFMQGARDLTWSYGSLLDAIEFRR